MRWRRILGVVAGVIVVLIVVAYVILTLYDYDKLKPMIAKAAREATGRQLTIGDHLKLRIGLSPTLVTGDIRFQNASWGSRPDMAVIKRFELKIALFPLIWGDVRIKRLILIEPDILIETDRHGTWNLTFETAEKSPPAESGKTPAPLRLSIAEMRIERGQIRFRDGRSGDTYDMRIDTLKATGDIDGPLDLALDGTYQDRSFRVTGTFGPLASLIDPAKPWPLELEAEVGGLTLEAEGTMQNLPAGRGIDLDVAARVRDLGELERFLGKPLAIHGPFEISGHAADPSPGTYRLSDLKVTAGESEMRGWVQFDVTATRPRITAVLSSQLLDLRSLLSKKGGKEAPEARPRAKGDKVFPDDPLSLESLRLVDGDIEIQADRLFLPRFALHDLNLHIGLNDGHLKVDPLRALVGGGTVDGRFDIGPEGEIAVVAARVKVDEIDMGMMLRELKISQTLEGKLDGEVNLKGRGRSIAELMAGLSGKAVLIMDKGRMANGYISLLGAEFASGILRLLNPLSDKADVTRVNCFVCGLDIKEGLVETTGLVFDTDQMSIIGEGQVNLRTETLDVSIKPVPKGGLGVEGIAKTGLSPGELAKPFKLGGTLAKPSLAVDPTEAAIALGKAGGGVALFGPVGIAAVLLSGGRAGENPCLVAIEAAEKGVRISDGGIVEKTTEGLTGTSKAVTKGVGGLLKGLFGK